MKRVGILILIAVLSVLFLATLYLRIGVVGSLIVDYGMGGVETNIIYGIQRLMAGLPLFAPIDQLPYSVIQYAPLHYKITAAVASALSVLPDDARRILAAARGLNLLYNLSTCIVIFFWLFKGLGVKWWKALVASLLAFFPFTSHFYARVDSLYEFFLILSVCFSSIGLARQEKKGGDISREILFYLGLGGFFAVLTLFSKQSFFILPLLIIGYLLYFHRQKEIIWSSLVGMAAGLLVAYLLALSSENLYYVYQNLVVGLSNGFYSGLLYYLIFHAYYHYFLPTVLVSYYVSVSSFIKERSAGVRLISFIGLCNGIWAIFIGFKVGSSLNYFVDLLLLSLVVITYSIDKTAIFNSRFVKAAAFLSYAFIGLILANSIHTDSVYEYYATTRYSDQLNIKKKIVIPDGKYVLVLDKPGLLNNLYWEHLIFPNKDATNYILSHDRSIIGFSNYGDDILPLDYVIRSKDRAEYFLIEPEWNSYAHILETEYYDVYRRR